MEINITLRMVFFTDLSQEVIIIFCNNILVTKLKSKVVEMNLNHSVMQPNIDICNIKLFSPSFGVDFAPYLKGELAYCGCNRPLFISCSLNYSQSILTRGARTFACSEFSDC